MNHHQVVIIGAGPAGLLLARMLANQNIDCVILENRNESFLRKNNRGGLLEHEIIQLLQKEIPTNQILEKSKVINQIRFQIDGEKIVLPLDQSAEKQAIIYDQKNIVADLLESLKADRMPIIWEAKGQRYEGLTEDKVKIIYTLNGQIHSMTGDYVVGCDGFRGISRRSIPNKLRQEIKEELPYAWLEWLVEKTPSEAAPIIAFHPNGFAMQMPNANGQTRFYMQVKRGTEMDDLPSMEEIWDDMENRLAIAINRGSMENLKLDYMRFFRTDKLQYGRLFIAGDAAHQVPRFGSKGMNMAFGDAAKLAKGFIEFYKNNNPVLIENYSQNCIQANSPKMEKTRRFNQLFHKEESRDYKEKVQEIHQLLTKKLSKNELIQYLIGS